jgi:hypothetical protein
MEQGRLLLQVPFSPDPTLALTLQIAKTSFNDARVLVEPRTWGT